MNTAIKIYKKSSTYFSHTKQESIVSKLEKKFYKIILDYGQGKTNMEDISLKLQSFDSELKQIILNYYFEDDLLEYLLNLAGFITNYSVYLQENKIENEDKNNTMLSDYDDMSSHRDLNNINQRSV